MTAGSAIRHLPARAGVLGYRTIVALLANVHMYFCFFFGAAFLPAGFPLVIPDREFVDENLISL